MVESPPQPFDLASVMSNSISRGFLVHLAEDYVEHLKPTSLPAFVDTMPTGNVSRRE